MLVFPGSNDDRDAAWALGALGADPCSSGTRSGELPRGTDAVVLPGGFSYGDYLRCGAIARFAPVMDAVRRVRGRGRSGARHLQRLPDPLRGRDCCPACCAATAISSSSAATCALRVERTDTLFTSRCEPGQELTIPVKNGEGNWYARRGALPRAGGVGPAASCATRRTATARSATWRACATRQRNVFGLMPHPEHAVDTLLGSGDGALLLDALVDAARERTFAAA